MRIRFDFVWLVFWGTLSSAWCLSSARELSATFDEPFYLRAGMTSWRTGSNRELMRAGTAPLPVDVQYLPIYLWEQVRGEPFDLVADFHTILPYSRAMNLLFWWALLYYGKLLARQFGGRWAGRFAVVLVATEPNLLAHAALASTDIAVTALITAFAYFYVRTRDDTRRRRWIVPGVLYGLSMTAKLSALTYVPLIMLAVELPRWRMRWIAGESAERGLVGRAWAITRSFRNDFWKSFLLGSAVLWIYCGTDWKPQQSFVKFANNLPNDHRWKEEATWLSQNVRAFPNAGEALAYQIKHNMRGHGVVLLGEHHPRAVWYYFPLALTIKLSLPVLLCFGLFGVRRSAILSPLGIATILLLAFSLNTRVQIGVRIVFPLIAMLLLTTSVGIAQIAERRRACLLATVSLVLLWPAVVAWPDGLRYANECWGGPAEVHHLLGESNADWGQGLKELDRWSAEHDLPLPKVWYYGMDPVLGSNPDRLLALHWESYNLQTPGDVWQYVRGKVVAVGTSILYGNPTITPHMKHGIAFFRDQRPVGRTGNFFIYDFREPTP